MRLTVYNGSPRTGRGNTEILLGDFISGFMEIDGNSVETFYLNTERRREEAAAAFADSELVLLGHPLYHHGMPGIVMTWLEMLEPVGPERDTKMAFLVQSGLPEAGQSRHLEPLYERLPARLGAEYLGTMIRGGVEAMQLAPDFMFKRMRRAFVDLGRGLGQTGELDGELVARLAGAEVLPWWRVLFFRAMKATGSADRSWNNELKKNGVLEEAFAQPYAPGVGDDRS
jgi:hypothetical protein